LAIKEELNNRIADKSKWRTRHIRLTEKDIAGNENFDGIFEYREEIFINALPKAVAVLTNCESLKADIIQYYGCDFERVHVIKFLPSHLFHGHC